MGYSLMMGSQSQISHPLPVRNYKCSLKPKHHKMVLWFKCIMMTYMDTLPMMLRFIYFIYLFNLFIMYTLLLVQWKYINTKWRPILQATFCWFTTPHSTSPYHWGPFVGEFQKAKMLFYKYDIILCFCHSSKNKLHLFCS